MTARTLRFLADSLEADFMTTEDRKGWVSDLRAHAKSVERAVMVDPQAGSGPDDSQEHWAGGGL